MAEFIFIVLILVVGIIGYREATADKRAKKKMLDNIFYFGKGIERGNLPHIYTQEKFNELVNAYEKKYGEGPFDDYGRMRKP